MVTRASLDKQPHEVAAMFDGVAARYDLTNDVLSLGQDRRWRSATAVGRSTRGPGERVLDLAAGTGHVRASRSPTPARASSPATSRSACCGSASAARPDLPFVAGDALRAAVRRRVLRRGDDLVRAAQRRRHRRRAARDAAG